MIIAHQRVLSSLRRGRVFGRDRQAVAATEFALILPVMLVVFVGVTEVGQAISISRKVTITARTVTDLVTQYAALSQTDMTGLLGAAAQIMAPYPSNNLTVTVSEVSTDSNRNATITWSTNSTAYPAGTKVTLPSGISLPNVTVIWGQAQYAYTPTFGDRLIGTTALSDQIYMNPRLCAAINYNGTNSVTTSTNTSSCPSAPSSSTNTSSTSSTSTSSTSSSSTTSTSSTSSSSTSSSSTTSTSSSSSTTSSTCSWSSWWNCSWW